MNQTKWEDEADRLIAGSSAVQQGFCHTTRYLVVKSWNCIII